MFRSIGAARVAIAPSLAACFLVAWALAACAADVPVPVQPPGFHSTIETSTGRVYDFELAEYVCTEILLHGGHVKDVKIFAQCCYGGGLLDDFQSVFGPGGGCEGTKWVGGAAAAWYETDADWAAQPDGFGCCWTSAMAGAAISPNNPTTPGAMRQGGAGDKVLDDINAANALDAADGAEWQDREEDPTTGKPAVEHSVAGSGNGGDAVTWHSPGEKHHVLMFSGADPDNDPAGPKAEQNIQNMTDALNNLDGASNVSAITEKGGSAASLFDAIDALCDGLDDNTQLVLYFTGHGDLEFDVFEFLDWVLPVSFLSMNEGFSLPQGMMAGLLGNLAQGDSALCTLDLVLDAPIQGEQWVVRMNGRSIPIPPGTHSGSLSLPVPWQSLRTGDNRLQIDPVGTPGAPMILDALRLSSGPIHEHHAGAPLAGVPATPAEPGWLRCVPNPAGRSSAIEYFLPQHAAVRITICDVAGRVLRRLVDESQGAGLHVVLWDGRAADGSPAPAGVYFVRMNAGGEIRCNRIIRVR